MPTFGEGHYEDELNGMPHHEEMEHPAAIEPDEAMEHPAAMEPGTTPLENTTGENFLEPPFLQLPWHAMLLQTC